MPLTITRIPERFQPGLAKINSLPLETVAAIAKTLEQSPSPTRLEDLRSAVEKHGLTYEEAAALMTSLHSLYVFRASSESAVNDFIPVLVGAMQATGKDALSVKDKREMIDKLTLLLSLKSLERASKVEQLKSDYQAIFYDAKIISDLRPLFDQPGDPPIGVMVNHTLKVIFHENGEHRELYVALEPDDIEVIKKTVERAELKVSSIDAFIKSMGVPNFS